MAIADKLLTVDEYLAVSDANQPSELVRGRIVYLNRPMPVHGLICTRISTALEVHAQTHDLGWVLIGDSGIVTERDPDTLRGADVAFYNFERIPRDRFPSRYPEAAPSIAVEVVSPSDRWSELLAKTAEYLHAGVQIVIVVNPQNRTAIIYFDDREPEILTEDDEIRLPHLVGFRLSLPQLFRNLPSGG